MIDNHYLPAPDQIEPADIRQLPDRTDLSGLYPDADQPEVARKRRAAARLRQAVNGHIIRSIPLRSLIVGLLAPLPALVGLLAVEYFMQSIQRGGSPIVYLPVIIVSLLLWVWLVSRLYSIVARRLDQAGVNPMSFLGFQLGCLALISKPLYDYMQISGAGLATQLPYGLAVIGISVVLAWTFLQLTVNQSLSSSVRLGLVAIVVTACLALPVIDLFVQLGWTFFLPPVPGITT